MKKVLIIGGGLAGLSSALFLQKAGFLVELIEASPKLGGRTYSFNYKGTMVDNGQHVLMGCYTNTLEYIDFIEARKFFNFSMSLSLNSIDANGKSYKLDTSRLFHPIDKLFGIMNFKLFSFSERFLILKLLTELMFVDENNIKCDFIYEFLVKKNQSKKVINLFWKNIIESTMNTELEQASAQMFVKIAKIIFFSDKNSANIIIPKYDLSTALIEPGIKKLQEYGGKISLSERVIGFSGEGQKVSSVETSKRVISNFDFVISAMPEYSLRRMIVSKSEANLSIEKLHYSPIVTIHIWLDNNTLTEKMYSFINGKFDWLFNHGTYISLLKSDAKNLVQLDKNKVIKIAFSELKKYFTILSNIEIKDFVVLKEKRATFISDPDSINKRKSIINRYSNLFVVGDWTNTGLPATIEGAIKSGMDVTEKIKIL